jgi:hypothetical protein
MATKEQGLMVVISWIEDLLIVGKKEMVEVARKPGNSRQDFPYSKSGAA